LIPDLGKNSDEIIPRLALMSTSELPGGSFLAGLILAAPFGAIMATVSSYLVVIASGVVRDVYQRFIRPRATDAELRWLSHTVMVVIGLMAVLANLQPVQFLQAIVVFSGSGAAATFTVSALMVCYWRRATSPGVFCSMLAGAATVLSLYLIGILGITPYQSIGQLTGFKPYYFLGIDPLIWGILNSLVAGIGVSLLTRPPSPELVSNLFDARPSTRPS
jgi:SSS family solute:Na+ symporter/sodium/pantothenate symporter